MVVRIASIPQNVRSTWLQEGALCNEVMSDRLCQAVETHGHTRLIVSGEGQVSKTTLAAVDEHARAVAAGFMALGMEAGDRVAIQLPALPETAIAHAAIIHLGGVAIPLPHSLGASELQFILGECRPRAIVSAGWWQGADRSVAPAQACQALGSDAPTHHIVIGPSEARDVLHWHGLARPSGFTPSDLRRPNDPACVIYTSGTTSSPKGAIHSHSSILSELSQTLDKERRTALSPWPPGHIAGVLGILRFLIGGQDTVLMQRWDADEAARLVERYQVFATSGTPLHLRGLLDAADANGADLSSLGSYLAGATTIPPQLVQRCSDAGLHTFRSYGLSEHPTISGGSPDDALELRLSTDGKLLPGVEVRIVDDQLRDRAVGEEGEILSRGPDRFLGYVDAALDGAAFLPGGWLRTGDIGRLDADRNLTITDRLKDVIIRGGETLSSREIEEYLLSLEGITDAAVVPLPDDRLGETVGAAVICAAGVSHSVETIRSGLEALGLSRAKIPTVVTTMIEFPRTASGKVKKQELARTIRGTV